ncbi:glycine-rich domain-containing protein [Acetobacter aceti]|uniref:Glycine-rich domain-containing protein n=1 Tax=Acetobacter aceti TaxID=435 RepID=A0A6S6PLY4_ACEAC|nr:hypothetical protein [Acetobacter aceti]BCI68060.1 hypothetical protein AAJCM20276_26840 [Acetobacter aceti]
MDRQIIYPGSVALDTDLLNAGRSTKMGLGRLAFLLFGEVSAAQGFTVALSSTDLTATVGEGTVISTGPIDQTAIGGLGGGLAADTDTVLNQYDSWELQTVPLTAGATNTIWAVCSETDGVPAVLPFYNSENPSQTLAGSGNSGADLPTQRQARVQIVCSTTAPTIPAGGAVVALYSLTVPSNATNLSGLTPTPQMAFYPTIPDLMRGRFLGTVRVNSSQNYTPSRWAKTLRVRMWGGGGSSGGAAPQVAGAGGASCGGCGGCGGYIEFLLTVSDFSWPQTLTVGSGGIGAYGGMGSGGGDTHFGQIAIAYGGSAGSTIAAQLGQSAWGQQANGGSYEITTSTGVQLVMSFIGENGQSPFIAANFIYSNGALVPSAGVPIPLIGPSTLAGTGGGNGTNSGSGVPTAPDSIVGRGSYGAGGGGTGSTGTGGTFGQSGAPGLILIEEYS